MVCGKAARSAGAHAPAPACRSDVDVLCMADQTFIRNNGCSNKFISLAKHPGRRTCRCSTRTAMPRRLRSMGLITSATSSIGAVTGFRLLPIKRPKTTLTKTLTLRIGLTLRSSGSKRAASEPGACAAALPAAPELPSRRVFYVMTRAGSYRKAQSRALDANGCGFPTFWCHGRSRPETVNPFTSGFSTTHKLSTRSMRLKRRITASICMGDSRRRSLSRMALACCGWLRR